MRSNLPENAPSTILSFKGVKIKDLRKGIEITCLHEHAETTNVIYWQNIPIFSPQRSYLQIEVF